MSDFEKSFVPDEAEDQTRYLEDLEDRLDSQFNQELVHRREPEIKRFGMLVVADGADWNPGSGEGLYRLSLANTWVFLG